MEVIMTSAIMGAFVAIQLLREYIQNSRKSAKTDRVKVE